MTVVPVPVPMNNSHQDLTNPIVIIGYTIIVCIFLYLVITEIVNYYKSHSRKRKIIKMIKDDEHRIIMVHSVEDGVFRSKIVDTSK